MSIQLGRFNLPLWLIVLLGGYLACTVSLRIAVRGSRDESREQRGLISNLVSSAFFTGFLIWKLFPLVTSFRAIVSKPLFLLYATPGFVGTLVAVASGVLYVVFRARTWRTRDDRRELFRGLVVFLSVFSIVVVVFSAGSFLVNAVESKPVTVSAPDFRLTGLDEKEYTLTEFRGQTVVINFWASWCPPCRAELPVLTRFYSQRPDVIFLSVNQTASEGSRQELADFVRENGLDYPILLDERNRVFNDYFIRGIPTTVIIKPDGTVAAKRVGVVTESWLERAVEAD